MQELEDHSPDASSIQVEALQPSCSVASTSSGFRSNTVSSLHATKHVDASRAVRFIRWSCSVAFWVSHCANCLQKAKKLFASRMAVHVV